MTVMNCPNLFYFKLVYSLPYIISHVHIYSFSTISLMCLEKKGDSVARILLKLFLAVERLHLFKILASAATFLPSHCPRTHSTTSLTHSLQLGFFF